LTLPVPISLRKGYGGKSNVVALSRALIQERCRPSPSLSRALARHSNSIDAGLFIRGCRPEDVKPNRLVPVQ
jgi:hypothetical protein